MDILVNQINGNLFNDGINALLNLNDEDFKNVIHRLSDLERPFLENIRFRYSESYDTAPSVQLNSQYKYDENGNLIASEDSNAHYSINEIFSELSKRQALCQPDSKEYTRISRLLHTRDINSLKQWLVDEDISKSDFYDKIFDILSSDNCLQKFLNFNENQDFFSLSGKQVDRGQYIKELYTLFIDVRNPPALSPDCDYYTDNFYLPEFNAYCNRLTQIFSEINYRRYMDPKYTFEHTAKSLVSSEPEWEINPKLYSAIFEDFPPNLSLEESALFIYCRMCKFFNYDEGYFFKKYLDNDPYSFRFSKEHLEQITPDSPITCWDFCRIYSNIVNSLSGNIKAVIIPEKMYGHFSLGVYTDKVSFKLEAIAKIGEYNDLSRVKNGNKPEGVTVVSDPNNVLSKKLDKVFQMSVNSGPSIQDLLSQLHETNSISIDDDFECKLQSLIDILEDKNIYGNEATQYVLNYWRNDFFGKGVKVKLLGEKIADDQYRRIILMEPPTSSILFSFKPKYLLDTNSLNLEIVYASELTRRFEDKRYVEEPRTNPLQTTYYSK